MTKATFVSLLRKRFIIDKDDGSPLTFRDLNPARPSLIITATNVTQDRLDLIAPLPSDKSDYSDVLSQVESNNAALSFSFTRQYFHALNSNIDTFPLVRALVASAAFPGLIDPTTLRNYHQGDCGTVTHAFFGIIPTSSTCANDHEQFVHLVDGGVHDNVGASQLQWITECLYRKHLTASSYIGTHLPWCNRQLSSPEPAAVVAFMIDASTTAANGKDPLIGEQRDASNGILLRLNNLSQSVDYMSMSNATQHKADFGKLLEKLRDLKVNTALVPIDILSLHDRHKECRSNNISETKEPNCARWRQAAEFYSKRFGKSINALKNDNIEDLFLSASKVGVEYSTSPEDNKALTDAAVWVVALRVSSMCTKVAGQESTMKLIFPSKLDLVCGGWSGDAGTSYESPLLK